MKKPMNLHIKNLVKTMNVYVSGNDLNQEEIKTKVQDALLSAVNSEAMSCEVNKPVDHTDLTEKEEIYTTPIEVLEVTIKADTKEEILDAIGKELEKCNNLHHFSGIFFGNARSASVVPFENMNGKLKEIHDDLNLRGNYNTYFIIEDVNDPNGRLLPLQVNLSKKNVSEKEIESFAGLVGCIAPYILKRTRAFKNLSS